MRTQRTDGIAAVKRLASHGLTQVVFRSETDAPRYRERGRVISSSGFAGVNPSVRHTIEALVATVDAVEPKTEQRLRDLLTTAFLASNGSVVVMLPAAVDPELAGPYGSRLDSTRHRVHPGDADVFAAPSQHLLSFNAPEHQLSGACRACRGTGVSRQLREYALVAHPDRPMHGGAFAIWTAKNYKYVNIQHDTIEGLRGVQEFSPDCALGNNSQPPPARWCWTGAVSNSSRTGIVPADLTVGPDRFAASKKSFSRNRSVPPRQHGPWRISSRPVAARLVWARVGPCKSEHCESGVTESRTFLR